MMQAFDSARREAALHPPGGLRRAQDEFIAIWGQMATKWGISRTMAEVHALLYIAGEPLHAEEVMERTGISRGSASTTLRSLVEWGIVRRVHRRGDRKEYFLAEQDVWTMFRTIVRERKKREIDPLISALKECRETAGAPYEGEEREDGEGEEEGIDPAALAAHRERLDGMLEMMTLVDEIGRRFVGPTGKGLRVAAKLLGRAS